MVPCGSALLRSTPQCIIQVSANTRHPLPVSKSLLSQESMLDRFEMMTANSEQIANVAVDTEKALDLCR